MKTIEEKRQELKNTLEMLENGVKEVFTSDRYEQYLNTMSKFHNYSIRNIMWIQMQKPDATRIAGLKTWNQLGRKVNKGEKSLKILAPMKHKKEIEMDKLDKTTRKQVLNNKGEPVKEKQTVEWISYRTVPVFDISQTNGKEIPSLVDNLKGEVENYQHLKESLIEIAKVPVTFEDIKTGGNGYYHLKEDRIAIKEGMSEKQTIKTLIHELAHSRLHSEREENSKDNTTRSAKEVEAESVAFVVSKHLGIDTDDYSFGYIASWSSDKDLKELESSLKVIQKESNEIISDVENKLEKKLNKENEADKKVTETEKEKVEMPYIQIVFSESNGFEDNEKIPFDKANKRFEALEKEVRHKKAEAEKNDEYYPYLKTKFVLNIDENKSYTMRYDIGDYYADNLLDFCNKQLNKEDNKVLKKSCENTTKKENTQNNDYELGL